MKAGQKMNTDDGKYQVCLFPCDIMNITQLSGSDSFSHCCGHPMDIIGNSARYPLYAPCDCHLIYQDSAGNTRGYQSDNEVATPSGIDYVCFSFTHDENPPSATKFKQGDLISHTGIAGQAYGDHCHLDQAKGQNKGLVSYGITCAMGNPCYALQDSAEPVDIWYINDTTVVNTMGLIFKKYDGGVTPPTPTPTKKKKMKLMYYMKGWNMRYGRF